MIRHRTLHISLVRRCSLLVCAGALAVGCDGSPLATENQENVPGAALNASAGVTVQVEDVFGQGMGGPVVSENGATIRRTANGISISLSMPTPEPGSYMYPSGGVFSGPGHPETFTLWAFVFNNPAECGAGPNDCGMADLGDTPAQGAAFFVTGHAVGGPNLTLSGHISRNTEPFPAAPGVPLQNPRGADVHLAVAPHGGLDPELLPAQIKTPTGPGPDIWWLALFVD